MIESVNVPVSILCPFSYVSNESNSFFSFEDVSYLDWYEVDDNLHIITWVRNPSTNGDATPVGISDEVLQEALLIEDSQATFQEYMGESFEYGVAPYQQATAAPTTPGDSEGLEVWAISVIVAGSVLLIIILAMIFECR